jgi:hypothetical protein
MHRNANAVTLVVVLEGWSNIEMNSIFRPSTMGLAFVEAAVKQQGSITKPTKDNWLPRRVALNMDRNGLGVIRQPAWNAHLSFQTAKKLKAAGILTNNEG